MFRVTDSVDAAEGERDLLVERQAAELRIGQITRRFINAILPRHAIAHHLGPFDFRLLVGAAGTIVGHFFVCHHISILFVFPMPTEINLGGLGRGFVVEPRGERWRVHV